MSNIHENGIAFVCCDGRLHHGEVNAVEALRQELGVDFVYPLSVPGPNGVLLRGAECEKDALYKQFSVLLNLKNPSVVAIAGHYNCAGNPVSNEEHDSDVREAVKVIREWGYTGTIVGFVYEHEHDLSWPLKEVARLEEVIVAVA